MTGSSSPETPPRKSRIRLILILALVIVAAAAATLVLVLRRKPTRTDFPNYEHLASQMPGNPAHMYSGMGPMATKVKGPMRCPTQEELRRFVVLWPTRPPEENALTDYVNACQSFRQERPQSYLAYKFNPRPSSGPDALQRRVENNKGALDTLKVAVQKEYFAVPILILRANGTPTLDAVFLSKMRGLAQVCCDAGAFAELQGRSDDAAHWYLSCLQMGRHMRHGAFIQNSMGIQMSATATQALNSLIENASLKDQTLQEIISFCEEAPPIAQEIEFALAAEEEWLRVQSELSDNGAGDSADQCRSVQDARKTFAAPLNILLRYDQTMRGPGVKRAKSDMEEQLWRWRHELARRQVDAEALKVRAAIALHKNTTGTIPAYLETLVPGTLAQLPLDPYTGVPFKYMQNGATWEMRSAGPDMKIDTDEPSRMQLQGNFWQKESHGEKPASDYIFVSTLDSNNNARQEKHPKADAEWYKMHPEDAPPPPPGVPFSVPGTFPPGATIIWAEPSE